MFKLQLWTFIISSKANLEIPINVHYMEGLSLSDYSQKLKILLQLNFLCYALLRKENERKYKREKKKLDFLINMISLYSNNK